MKPKKILLDLSFIYNRYIGLGEYSFNLGLHIAKNAKEYKAAHNLEFYFIVPKDKVGCFGGNVHYLTERPSEGEKFDLFHSVHQCGDITKVKGAKKSLLTIHDINFMYEKKGLSRIKHILRMWTRMKCYNAFVYISNFVKQDVRRTFNPKKPEYVIYNGVTDLTNSIPSNSVQLLEDLGIPAPEKGFLFHLSSLAPKKNPMLLVEMMQYLPQERLVMVGRWDQPHGEELKKRIEELGLKNIIGINHIPEEAKIAMYHHCRGFLFPSVCEGFGLPPIEALSFGKAVFLSKLTSLPEVGGDYAYYFDELEPEKMALEVKIGLVEFYNDIEKIESAKKYAKGFSWDKCTEEHVNLYLTLTQSFDYKSFEQLKRAI